MAHLSPPPSPPNTLPSVTSKLLNYPNIMNGLDKLNFPLASSALRANLNTALQNKLSQGKRRLLSDILIRMKSNGIKASKIKSEGIKLNKTKSGEILKMNWVNKIRRNIIRKKKKKELKQRIPSRNFGSLESRYRIKNTFLFVCFGKVKLSIVKKNSQNVVYSKQIIRFLTLNSLKHLHSIFVQNRVSIHSIPFIQ